MTCSFHYECCIYDRFLRKQLANTVAFCKTLEYRKRSDNDAELSWLLKNSLRSVHEILNLEAIDWSLEICVFQDKRLYLWALQTFSLTFYASCRQLFALCVLHVRCKATVHSSVPYLQQFTLSALSGCSWIFSQGVIVIWQSVYKLYNERAWLFVVPGIFPCGSFYVHVESS